MLCKIWQIKKQRKKTKNDYFRVFQNFGNVERVISHINEDIIFKL